MYLLFDIGGTHMRFCASHEGKTIGTVISMPTPRFFDVGISLFAKTASELAQGEKITRVAGGIAGALHRKKDILIGAPNLSDWIGKPLKKELQLITGTQVIIENDAAIEGLGEALYGSGKQYTIVAYITIGTGVGGVRIVNKRIDKNAMGFEPGHQIIDIKGDMVSPGNSAGYLEEYIGGKAIEKKYDKKPQDIHDPKIWNTIATYLAIGLYNTVLFWSPDVIVLGGSMMNHIPIEKVKEIVNTLVKIFPTPIRIEQAVLGDRAGMYGALSLVTKTNY